MARITLGEVGVPGDRFPGIYLAIDGKRYLVRTVDASRFGQVMADAARWTVARVDIDVLRLVILEIEASEL